MPISQRPAHRRRRRFVSLGGETRHRSLLDPQAGIEAAAWLLGREIRRLEVAHGGRGDRLPPEEREFLLRCVEGLGAALPALTAAVAALEPKPSPAVLHDELLAALAAQRAAMGLPPPSDGYMRPPAAPRGRHVAGRANRPEGGGEPESVAPADEPPDDDEGPP